MRATRSHRNNRRSHHALQAAYTTACVKCGAQRLRHRMCDNCGTYAGRSVIDKAGELAARVKKQTAKRSVSAGK